MSTIPYRPSIDGLRAFAVSSAVVFHLERAWLPGGFVGVDVFFVISGYLISWILLAEINDERFSFGEFYQRRIARLMPAFFLVAFSTFLGAFVTYTALDLSSTGASLTAASLGLANVKSIAQGNYFQLFRDAQPYLHYWSLAVEEQFYLVFPPMLLVARRGGRTGQAILLVLLVVASFAGCAYLSYSRPTWAFYLFPARAWELAGGGLLALGTTSGRLPSRPRWLQPMGLALLLASFWLVSESKAFPGFQALLPVTGTLLLLWPEPVGPKGYVARLLEHPILVALGQRSYSLYLWHWPVFCLVDYRFFGWPLLPRLGLKLVLTALLTWISYRYVESPARRRLRVRRVATRRLGFAFALGCSLAGAGLGLWTRLHFYADATVTAGRARHFNTSGKAGEIVLIGDSNGSMYGTALRDLAESYDYRLTVISASAGDPLPNGNDESLWRASLQTISERHPDMVIFAAAWAEKLQEEKQRLPQALEQLRPLTGRIILLTQPPIRPETASRDGFRNGHRPPFFEQPEPLEQRNRTNRFVKAQASGSVQVVDIEHLFKREDGSLIVLDDQGRQLFQDGLHLSGQGAERVAAVLAPLLQNH